MIPSSYFYKDLYRRHWLEPEQEGDEAVAMQASAVRPTLLQRVVQACAGIAGLLHGGHAQARLGHRAATTVHRSR